MTSHHYNLDDDIAAIATPLAPSALGIIRTSGQQSITYTARFFSRPQALLNAAGHTIVYGWIHDNGMKIDEVTLCVYRAPKSNTGENAVEIICHGGPAVVKAIYALCITNGFRPAERGEFTFRAFMHGKTDLTKAEAVREIIDSKTGTAREKAVGRLAGTVFRKIAQIKQELVLLLAQLEVGIEYPEDEHSLADGVHEHFLDSPLTALHTLDVSWQSEKIYQDGVRLVLAGKTNAGKSSLFNALLKEERAIVSDIHGTTRDWLEAHLDFKGIPVTLFDTAGLRNTEDSIEALGVQRSEALIQEAAVILYLIDGSVPVSQEDCRFILGQKGPLIIVLTKADKTEAPQPLPAELQGIPPITVSAHSGEGLEELIAVVVERITACMPDAGTTEPALGTERQKRTVHTTVTLLEHAKQAAKMGYPPDAIMQDIEDAVQLLGEITGEVHTDDILDSIFSHFCVGK
ncbi:MAG: tRNA uridine-5-carboxymethylaminomethyl(34) synthesis GTPase MnmE [Treponema sp.]